MFAAGASAVSGWLSIAAIVLALAAGVYLRRGRRAPPLVQRMRPHYALGYASVVFAAAHLLATMGMLKESVSFGITSATVALIALGLQTFVGASLQDPGSYRRVLRRWHISIVVVLAVTLTLHVTVNGAF